MNKSPSMRVYYYATEKTRYIHVQGGQVYMAPESGGLFSGPREILPASEYAANDAREARWLVRHAIEKGLIN